jgi:DNA repair protein RadC
VVALLQPELAGQGVEELHGLYLGRRGQLLHQERLSRGSPANTIVHTGTVLRSGLLVRASRLVLVHNHPSGDPRPSPEDLEVTRRVAQGGRLVGVELVDHIILAGASWCSLAQEGLLPRDQWRD